MVFNPENQHNIVFLQHYLRYTVYAEIFQKWQNECKIMGITIEHSRLHSLYFADDHVVTIEEIKNLCYMIQKLDKHYKQAGLIS